MLKTMLERTVKACVQQEDNGLNEKITLKKLERRRC